MLFSTDGTPFMEVFNSVKTVICEEDSVERHVNVTDEGIIVDLVRDGKVIKTMSITHQELLESV